MTNSCPESPSVIIRVLAERYSGEVSPGDAMAVRVSRYHHGWWDVERNGSHLHSFPDRSDADLLCHTLQKEIAL